MTAALRISLVVHIACALGWLIWPAAWGGWLALIAVNHAVLMVASLLPRSRILGPNLTRLPAAARARGEIALTFDDGPDPEVTPQVLDLLDAHGARATFFCIGERATAHPDLVRQICARGHRVENHSSRHPMGFGFFGPARMTREIASAQSSLSGITGVAPRYFRAPMGIRNPLLAPVLTRLGLRYASWTRRGYDAVDADAHKVYARLARDLRAGDILLLHDGPSPYAALRPDAPWPVVLDVLPRLLTLIAERGLRPVVLSDARDEAPDL